MTDRILKKIGTYCAQPDFQPEIIGRVSLAAKSLCMWVRAMEVYGRIYRVVEPKKQRLAQATSQLQEKQAVLADAKAKLKEVGQKCLKLQFWQLSWNILDHLKWSSAINCSTPKMFMQPSDRLSPSPLANFPQSTLIATSRSGLKDKGFKNFCRMLRSHAISCLGGKYSTVINSAV